MFVSLINACTTNMYKRMLANNGKGTEKFIFEEIITTEYVVSIIHYSLFISVRDKQVTFT